jgi:hypothetical protein
VAVDAVKIVVEEVVVVRPMSAPKINNNSSNNNNLLVLVRVETPRTHNGLVNRLANKEAKIGNVIKRCAASPKLKRRLLRKQLLPNLPIMMRCHHLNTNLRVQVPHIQISHFRRKPHIPDSHWLQG